MKRLYVNPALNTDKDCLLTYMCVDCKKTYKEIFDRYLSNTFENRYQFCDGDIKNFCLRLLISAYG